jgi:diguanylate cyclase (GGDEF)-like protein
MLKRTNSSILIQDIGLLAFLMTIFLSLWITFNDGSKLLIENGIMLFVMVIAVLLVTFSTDIAAIVVVGSQILCFTAYKIFIFYRGGTIDLISYSWLLLPFAAIGSMKLFCMARNRIETENAVLREQTEELVMIDPLTELYNLRSFYYDIPRQLSFFKRHKMPLTLLIVRLRYAQELKRVLSKRNYDAVKQRLAQIVQDTIRVEDRLYSIDDDGRLAVILTCDALGAVNVRNRIKSNVENNEAFDKIAETSIKVEAQIAYLEYDDTMEDNMVNFKTQVENELQYDV